MNYNRLSNDILGVVARQLHYYENKDRICDLKTAAEVNYAIDGGAERYMNNIIYRSMVDTMSAHLMRVIINNIEQDEETKKTSHRESPVGGLIR